jgi:hypothetical protein
LAAIVIWPGENSESKQNDCPVTTEPPARPHT